MELITLSREQYLDDMRAAARDAAREGAEMVLARLDAAPRKEWLPTREAARYLSVSPSTLKRYAADSDVIVRERSGGSAPDRYLRSSLDAFLASRS